MADNQIKLTFETGCSLASSDTAPILANQKYSFAAWSKDSDPLNSALWLYFPLKDDLTETITTYTGYTRLFISTPTDKVFLRSENALDLSAYGYGSLTVDEILSHADIGVKIFCEVIRDDNDTVIGIKNLLIYSVEPTPECKLKSYRALKIFPAYAEKDVNGNLVVDVNGNYVVTADWYK